ncbi:uracil-DNA glycosylase [Streptomyces sp. NBC_00038]|uniref:uracil-DNA glycosylase n=1 Tax=Streptomyces sp. NBC_00038 TaxID=2903615 RepID=UPI0022562C06|nr:uracil-DNA glycosylase [Streptomyces sp. NBC_00038]MCX5562839.1 uracil-DNA glycosylase [Streptomyces sp. NBC_00038]
MTSRDRFRSTALRALRDPDALSARLQAVRTEPSALPLNDGVDRLRGRLGEGESVPWFDPASGGIEARSLFLLEAPGQKSMGAGAALRRTGSGIISIDNGDPTARNCWMLRAEAGLPYWESLHWNIVPWYLGTADRIAAPGQTEIQRAAPFLHEVISMLPALEVVVPMGRKAQAGWATYQERYAPKVHTLPTWHPSPRVFASRPAARQEILDVLRRAAELLGAG